MRIGIADTTFSRVDMANIAVDVIEKIGKDFEIERYTVPGCKDLPVACKKLIEEYKCELVLAFGWVGDADIDEVCAHEANIGLINAELSTGKHILKVFVHEREADNERELKEIAKDRAEKHTINALALLKGKTELTKSAGKGLRQGSKHAGGLL